MSDETIVAVFETAAQADDAVSALESAGVPSKAIERHSKQSSGERRGRESAPQGTGFFFWDMMFAAAAPHQDRPEYERSIERGETIVAVTVSEQDADKVMAVLEDRSPIGLDTHRQQVEGRDVEEASGADKGPIPDRPYKGYCCRNRCTSKRALPPFGTPPRDRKSSIKSEGSVLAAQL